MRTKISLALLSIFLLVSCSTGPQFRVNYLQSFDFSSIESYSLYGRNSPFSELQSISDVTRNSIEIAIENGFDALGYRYQLLESADVVIGYHIVNRAKELRAYNRSVRYCRVCLPNSNTEKSNSKTASNGSLIIDIINLENNRTVWRSVSQLKLKDNDNSLEVQEKLEKNILAMLKNLPRS